MQIGKLLECVYIYIHNNEQTMTITLRLRSARIASRNVHGTGCTLSSAIAAYLARGLALPQAVERARAYTLQAIRAGAAVQTGQGHGPLCHGYAPVPMVTTPTAAGL